MCYRGKDLCRNCFREVATFERHQGGKDEKRERWENQEKEKAQKISLILCSLHSSEMYRRQIVNKCIHQKVLIRTMKKKKG